MSRLTGLSGEADRQRRPSVPVPKRDWASRQSWPIYFAFQLVRWIFPLRTGESGRFPLRELRSDQTGPGPGPVQCPYAGCPTLLPARRPGSGPAAAPHLDAQLRPDRRRLGAGLPGKHPGVDQRHHRAGRSRLAAQLRPRVGDRRIRHAAPVHGDPNSAGERAGQDRRPHPRDPAAHRPQPALGGGHDAPWGSGR